MRKPTICIGENKVADLLRSNGEADQRLCFRYSDSTIPLLLKSEISSRRSSCSFLCLHSTVCVEPVRKPYCWFSHEAAHILITANHKELVNAKEDAMEEHFAHEPRHMTTGCDMACVGPGQKIIFFSFMTRFIMYM